MTNSSEERLKIAVFIDFDNIAIGVKQSLNRNFDVGTVLEAIKEKGQVISKIAYGDWKRAEDFSRAMTQHAVQMVQRNLTPGGDKNGADIALALDALEMAFTRDHINAFVIVGGDSDFIALVEKLKQYDKTVFVVGGRAFTSVILQKNCHEFISYENLLGIQTGMKKTPGRTQVPSTAPLDTALPLIQRALKVLSDREVSPQLGLLKSTLLQLDSTFSERDYGVSSFRDFIQKLADAGYVNLKQVDRSLMVELKETEEEPVREAEAREDQEQPTASETAVAAQEPETPAEAEPVPQPPPTTLPQSDAIPALQQLLRDSKVVPHWPMYLRTFKQYLRSQQPSFDERQYGLSSTYDLVRLAQKEGLLRVERNRQGILRIYPADKFPVIGREEPVEEPMAAEMTGPEAEPAVAASEVQMQEPEPIPETVTEPPIAEAETGSAAVNVETPPETAQPEREPAMQIEALDVIEEIPQPEPQAKPKPKRTRRAAATAKPARAAKTTKRTTKSSKPKTKPSEEEIPF